MQSLWLLRKTPKSVCKPFLTETPLWGDIACSHCSALVIQKCQWGDKSLRSAPRGSFPEAATHFQRYYSQGRSLCKRSQLSLLRWCPCFILDFLSDESPLQERCSHECSGSKNCSCIHGDESILCSLCFLLDGHQC